MTWATDPGSEISPRWPAWNAEIVEPARSAMAFSAVGGMIRSSDPMRYQDGMVRQAGTPDGSFSAPIVAGRWVAASTRASCAGRPELPAGRDAELREDLAQVPFDRVRAEEEPRPDLDIREAAPGQT